ncbi:MAG: arginine deiminase-related protein [Planctomycetaceae bacterium]
MSHQPKILMCPPDHYGIEYEINPWMNRQRGSDRNAAHSQWRHLTEQLEQAGAVLRFIDPVPGLPDLVFTANAGLVHQSCVYLSRFRHSARQPETEFNRIWFQQAGFECKELPIEWSFEGAGDALFCGATLFGGYIIRSDAAAMQWLAAEIGCEALALQLVDDRYYHLDTCFCPLDAESAIWYPPAFDDYAQRVVPARIPRLIEVRADEAVRFACNAVVIGETVVLNTGCPQLCRDLTRAGFRPVETPLDEFIKAGGSAKCLTLRLDGEDAKR